MSAIIEISNLFKSFGPRKAVEDLSLSISEGAIFGFIGPNGAGKTSTIRIMTTLLKPDKGDVKIAGKSILQNPLWVRKNIGYMPDFFGVYNEITVWEYLDFFCGCYNIPEGNRKTLIEDLLTLVDLYHRKADFVNKLSRGMKQRLSLARTLIHDPDILILDEPASGLDPRARIEIRQLLVELAKMGKTIFFSTHILSDVSEICTHIGIIESGNVIVSGSIEEVQRHIVPHRKITMTILNKIDHAITLLSNMSHISNIIQRNNPKIAPRSEISFTIIGPDDLISSTLSELVAANIPVVNFSDDKKDLEDVFMKITKGAI